MSSAAQARLGTEALLVIIKWIWKWLVRLVKWSGKVVGKKLHSWLLAMPIIAALMLCNYENSFSVASKPSNSKKIVYNFLQSITPKYKVKTPKGYPRVPKLYAIINKKLNTAELTSIATEIRQTHRTPEKLVIHFYFSDDMPGQDISYASALYPKIPGPLDNIDTRDGAGQVIKVQFNDSYQLVKDALRNSKKKTRANAN